MSLSSRGQVKSDAVERGVRYEMPSGLYDPELNPEGLITLTMAENCLMNEELIEYVNKNVKIHADHLKYRSPHALSPFSLVFIDYPFVRS